MIQQVEMVSIQEIKDFTAKLLEECKKRIVADGHIPRICYVFSSADKVPDSNEAMKAIPLDEKSNKDPNACAITLIDLQPDENGLVNMLRILNPRFSEAYPELAELGKKMGVDEDAIPRHVLNAFFVATGGKENDIIAAYMKLMIKKMDAYAYVHQSETWAVSMSHEEDRKNFSRDLSKDPRSEEAICVSMETFEYTEMHTVRFHRTERNTGQVTGFEETQSLRTGDGNEIRGRLHGILRPMPRN